jgi:hypothetical protein
VSGVQALVSQLAPKYVPQGICWNLASPGRSGGVSERPLIVAVPVPGAHHGWPDVQLSQTFCSAV